MSANDSCNGTDAISNFANGMLNAGSRFEMNTKQQQQPLQQAEQAFSGMASAAAFAAGLTAVSPAQQLPPDSALVEDLRQQISDMRMSPELSQSLLADYQDFMQAMGPERALTGPLAAGDGEDQAESEALSWTRGFWSQQAGSSPLPHQREYVFHDPASNPFAGVAEGLMDAGVQLFQQGRLDEAVLAFEAELRHNDSSDVWRWLGSTHAENDEDQTAIICLERAVQRDDQNLEALLDLGVSYTNELFQDEAMKYLELWMRKHPVYADIPQQVSQVEAQGGSFKTNHERIVAMFQAALTVDQEDPDLYTVLGVIFNLSRDYESAESAFQEALKRDPGNYSLWNKLGATQANSARIDGSKAAVRGYRKAIELKPTYTRAWVNMGISYSNQAMYDLAAKYYLKSLSLNASAKHVWAYLRIALQCMERQDLIPFVQERNLEAFHSHFTF